MRLALIILILKAFVIEFDYVRKKRGRWWCAVCVVLNLIISMLLQELCKRMPVCVCVCVLKWMYTFNVHIKAWRHKYV